MHARVKKLNFHANTSAAAKRNEINPKYENMRKIHRLLTNQNPGFLYKVSLCRIFHEYYLQCISNCRRKYSSDKNCTH
jgi:hypothetical protein